MLASDAGAACLLAHFLFWTSNISDRLVLDRERVKLMRKNYADTPADKAFKAFSAASSPLLKLSSVHMYPQSP